MTAPVLGVVAGGVLGLLDGLSAWFYPEARTMMIPIVLGSTIKGVLTGLATGVVAKRSRSLALGVLTGVFVGFLLSTVAALGQPDHYWEIVLPGMLVGVIAAFATQRARTPLLLVLFLLPASLTAQERPASTNQLSALDHFIGRWQGTTEGQPGKGTVRRRSAIRKARSMKRWVSSAPIDRARETYRLIAPDEFEEIFELSGPGKPLEVYSRARLKRIGR